MNQTFKKLTYTTMLGATLLGLGSVEVFANELNSSSEGRGIETLTTVSDQTVVDIPDKELLAQIRQHLKKQTGDITVGDIKKLTELSLYDGIKSLKGLEYAINLKRLALEGTSVTDLSPIAGLTKIETLSIVATPITDLSPITNFTNIKQFGLMETNITDLSPLKNSTNLEELSVFNNTLNGLEQLKNADNIKQILIGGNSLLDLNPIKGLNKAETLLLVEDYSMFMNLSGGTANTKISKTNQVSSVDLTPIKDFTNLKQAMLFGGSFNNLSGIEGATNLETLLLIGELSLPEAESNKLSSKLELSTPTTPIDLTPLNRLKNLQTLMMFGSSYTDLNGLEGLTNLQTLLLIEDLSLMLGMNVSELSNELEMFTPTTPTDLTPLKGLRNLQMLMMMGRSYSDLSGIEELTNLQMLLLMATPVEDLSPLAKLSNLKGLMLGFTSAYDFSPLKHLELEVLQLLPLQASVKNVQLTKNTLKNPYQFSDGTYLKFKELQDGITQSEDGSTFYFENPQKGEIHLLATDICFSLEMGSTSQTNRYIENEWAQSLLNKFNKNRMYFDCSGFEQLNTDEENIMGFETQFVAALTIDNLIGEVNPTLNIGEQTDNQKTITIDFTDSFYPIERIILPDGTEVKGNQATFVVSETNDYIFKAYDSQGNEYIETQYVEIESATAPDEEDTPSDENKPNEENKPSIPEEDTPSDTDKPSTPDQPSVEPDQDESDKDEVKPSNPNEENQESSQPNDNQNSSNQTETHKPTQRPTVEAGLSSIGLIGLGFVSLISGAVYLKRKKK